MGFRYSWIVVALLLVAVQLPAQEKLKVLRVSAIPDENPQELLRIYAPFAKYLSKEIGLPVKFLPVVDYAATVEGLAACARRMPSSKASSSPVRDPGFDPWRISRGRPLPLAVSVPRRVI